MTVSIVWIRLDRQSTTTRMALYPFESRSSPIMSMEIGITCQHQSGTLLGISFPTFCVGKVFVRLHVSHPTMNLVTYLDSPGHQKFHETSSSIFHRLGCPVTAAPCFACTRSCLSWGLSRM